MMRSGGGLIMVLARDNNLFIQQLFPLNVGPIVIKVNECCKTTFDLCGSCCCGGGGGGDCDFGGGSEKYDRSSSCPFTICLLILLSFLENLISHSDQIGKGIKRKTTTIDGPLIKRRTTTYDDLEDSFSISIIGEQKMPKFNMTSTKYKVTFQNLDIRGIPNT